MLPSELRKLRERIFHTQQDFAKLLGGVRGVPVSRRTVEDWESGRNKIMLYQSDILAICHAIKPHAPICANCGAPSVVRKVDADLCGECATPLHRGQRPRVSTRVAYHHEIIDSIRPLLTLQASA